MARHHDILMTTMTDEQKIFLSGEMSQVKNNWVLFFAQRNRPKQEVEGARVSSNAQRLCDGGELLERICESCWKVNFRVCVPARGEHCDRYFLLRLSQLTKNRNAAYTIFDVSGIFLSRGETKPVIFADLNGKKALWNKKNEFETKILTLKPKFPIWNRPYFYINIFFLFQNSVV